jgi:hypothetical protein
MKAVEASEWTQQRQLRREPPSDRLAGPFQVIRVPGRGGKAKKDQLVWWDADGYVNVGDGWYQDWLLWEECRGVSRTWVLEYGEFVEKWLL